MVRRDDIVMLLQVMQECCFILLHPLPTLIISIWFTLNQVYYIDCSQDFMNLHIIYHLRQMLKLKTYILCTWLHTNPATFLASWGGKAPLEIISTAICRYAKVLQTNSLNFSVMSTTCEIPNFLANCVCCFNFNLSKLLNNNENN